VTYQLVVHFFRALLYFCH